MWVKVQDVQEVLLSTLDSRKYSLLHMAGRKDGRIMPSRMKHSGLLACKLCSPSLQGSSPADSGSSSGHGAGRGGARQIGAETQDVTRYLFVMLAGLPWPNLAAF